ncbi:unnamed protein product [Caenorhabditis auriculariae]|uniref:Uncharacterized protein n=1 Tax=Caenorhabditis auriculariae TaxID=2777116 RepID=A0A8S1HHS0_9PELO|nr:unnamed protein product [Caenorhabditis auriculariae]
MRKTSGNAQVTGEPEERRVQQKERTEAAIINGVAWRQGLHLTAMLIAIQTRKDATIWACLRSAHTHSCGQKQQGSLTRQPI